VSSGVHAATSSLYAVQWGGQVRSGVHAATSSLYAIKWGGEVSVVLAVHAAVAAFELPYSGVHAATSSRYAVKWGGQVSVVLTVFYLNPCSSYCLALELPYLLQPTLTQRLMSDLQQFKY
jgi:hypothetical protein